ncbi:hypothetical protein QC763_302660 [Podospora pseudopauciseta]|uniref:Heterokaryon incompatibility domain-containing protein n=1 Tax=Podospora pseudopauciseta TaxID=2093780 RepID=A0ABR0HF61_9PEZI|nr:hypothetical protein QC763_302660 [Podospora pseudopauciseta]
MRLINVSSLQIEEFYGTDIPPYAILSHTWEATEASFQQWTKRVTRIRKFKHLGFEKIYAACKRARGNGLGYVWADTVCIDRTSSAELSEAINSMYAWYENAQVCYVYLSDVRIPSRESNLDVLTLFRRSRWFTRGWTLQELLAPSNIVFYTREWVQMGTKQALAVLIREITGIDEGCLRGTRRVTVCSVAQRMSWASRRVTTREEDITYSLLGIFGISMPLLYGEGSQNAFRRLQEEIIKVSDDQSILAFNTDSSDNTLLAHHPSDFASQGGVRPSFAPKLTPPFTMSNAGLSLTTPLIYTMSPYWVLAVLNCVELHWAQEDVRARSITCLPLLGRDKKFMRARAPVTLISLGVDLVGNQGTLRSKHIDSTPEVGGSDSDSNTALAESTSTIAKTTPLEIQDLTTRKDTDILVTYFSRIYPLYGTEMDEAMKGFEVIDVGPSMKIPDRGFMIAFPRGMGSYRYLDSFPKGDLYPNISFFMPSATPPTSTREKMEENRGNVTRGLLVYSHEMAGRFKPGFLEEIEIVGIYLALDSSTGNWTCRILDLERRISGPDLEHKWIVKGDEMVLDKPEEWPHYDQQRNMVVAARTRFETTKGHPCKEAIMVEIVFDLKELLKERDLEG